MAVELAAHGIRVNCVSPGPADTQRSVDLVGEEKMAEFRASFPGVPLAGCASAEDIAEAFLYLASDAAALRHGPQPGRRRRADRGRLRRPTGPGGLMRITPDVALVGGGSFTGFGLSADFDAHVYLLDGGDELALVDCGMGTELGRERVLERMPHGRLRPRRRAAPAADPLPHGSRRGRRRRYREELGLRVAIGADVQAALEGPDHEATQFGPAQRAGIFPADYEYRACPRRRPARPTATSSRSGGCACATSRRRATARATARTS